MYKCLSVKCTNTFIFHNNINPSLGARGVSLHRPVKSRFIVASSDVIHCYIVGPPKLRFVVGLPLLDPPYHVSLIASQPRHRPSTHCEAQEVEVDRLAHC